MKKVKRKIIFSCSCILVCIALLLYGYSFKGLLGKGKKDISGRNKHYVAMITKTTRGAFWKSVHSGANAAATEYNLSITIDGPENEEDYEMQNELIGKVVEEGAEVIVFSAIDYNASTKTIQEAVKKGVKVVIIDSDVNSDQVSCRIGTDNYLAGCMAGEAVLKSGEEELEIGIVNFDKNTQNGQQREAGFQDTVLKDKRANIVKTINVFSRVGDAKEGTMQLLREHPEINVIVTFNEWTSLGVGYAIEELGFKDEIMVVAFDSNVVSVWMLEKGEVDALIVQNPYAMGYLGIECAYQLINGLTPEADIMDTDITLITRENMFEEDCQKVLFMFD